MTITLNWWMLPALITLASFIWSFIPYKRSGYGDDVVQMFILLGVIILNLLAWLIWAVLT